VFAENSYHVLSDQQPVTCRSQLSYAVLAGIEVIKVKMDSDVETFISGTQGQGFGACPPVRTVELHLRVESALMVDRAV
jgi:hypothetical protein